MRRIVLVTAALAAGLTGSIVVATAAPSGAPTPVCGPYGDLPWDRVPIASRDGRVLAWMRWSWRHERTTVFTARPDGSGARRVSVPGLGRDEPVALSPDGGQVLIDRHSEPAARILASTVRAESRYVTDTEARELRRTWRTPEWSPDGLYQAVADSGGVWVVPADGGPRRRIAPLSGSESTWSPRGDLIAFSSSAATGADGDIYVVRPDGSGLRALTESGFGAYGPVWSPDGSSIAFDHDLSNYHEGAGIGVVRADGSGLRMLKPLFEGPDKRLSGEVAWIDGKRLVFVSEQRREGPRRIFEIHTLGVDGRGERRVTFRCHLGTSGADVLHGSVLGDSIRAFGGNDVVIPGPGEDVVVTGPGNDLVRARDGARDVIRCESGRDVVLADRRDVVSACERVRRSG